MFVTHSEYMRSAKDTNEWSNISLGENIVVLAEGLVMHEHAIVVLKRHILCIPFLIHLDIANKLVLDTHCNAFKEFLQQYSALNEKFRTQIESFILSSFKVFDDKSMCSSNRNKRSIFSFLLGPATLGLSYFNLYNVCHLRTSTRHLKYYQQLLKY